MVTRSIVFVFMALTSSLTWAICFPRVAQITAPRAVANRALKIAQIDSADRKNADEFGATNKMNARSVESRYAASGDLICPGVQSQAQVTVTNDTLVTTAHSFNLDMKCKKIEPISACRFFIKVNGVEKEYRLRRIIGTGHKCPRPKGESKESPVEDDWIVIRLEQPVDPTVKPYQIPLYGKNKVSPDDKVVAVAKSQDWPKPSSSGLRDLPRHYGNCETKAVLIQGASGQLDTNCDMSAGSSGGGLLTPGESPVLLGIVRGEQTPTQLRACDVSKLKTNSGAYEAGCWGGAMVPVAGEFKKVIMEANGLTEGAQPGQGTPGGFKLPGLKL